jgi:hypothetical protein
MNSLAALILRLETSALAGKGSAGMTRKLFEGLNNQQTREKYCHENAKHADQ